VVAGWQSDVSQNVIHFTPAATIPYRTNRPGNPGFNRETAYAAMDGACSRNGWFSIFQTADCLKNPEKRKSRFCFSAPWTACLQKILGNGFLPCSDHSGME
jgi:hypothetical protein